MSIVYDDGQEMLPSGTKVRVAFYRNFECEPLEEILRREAAAQQKLKEERSRERDRQNQRKQSAEAFNRSLNLPFSWRTGINGVLSGLSEGSWGDGTNRRTVGHVELLENFQSGRLKRKAGEFLCKSSGKRWSQETHYQWSGGDGELYDAQVSCKACLRLALRFGSTHECDANQNESNDQEGIIDHRP